MGNILLRCREALCKHGKKTVTKEELRHICGVSEEKELFPLVEALVSEGLLNPVKASGTNGNRKYPLYLKYRISPADPFQNERRAIRTLHPLLQSHGILMKKP